MQPGGYSGYDKGLSVLAKYGLVSEKTYRGRGALLCQTQQGLKMIRPYAGSADRVEKIYDLLEHLRETGHTQIDQFLRNEEGSLVSTDKDGISYIVKDWWDDRECDARSGSDVIKAVKTLACVHKNMFLPFEEKRKEQLSVQVPSSDEAVLTEMGHASDTDLEQKTEIISKRQGDKELHGPDLRDVYRRHNQELKKIREFIRKRKQKNSFEYMCLEHMPRYMEYGQETLHRLMKSSYEEMRLEDKEKRCVCHNACTQHSFLMAKEGVILVNYEHYCYDNHMADLAQFMRKVLEKHAWNRNLADKIIKGYDEVNPLSKDQYEQLVLRLSYPEKFWKIVNFYYNNNKAFFPERNVEKLIHQMENESNWLTFIEHLH